MNRTVVMLRFVYKDDETFWEKQNVEWKVVDIRFMWVE